MHALLGSSSVVCATPALRRRDAVGRRGAVVRVSAESRDSEASTPEPPATMPRRRLINLAAATTALVVSSKTSPALAGEFTNDAAMAMLNRQGKVKLTDAEWKEKLKDQPFAYDVLRREATERPFSSPLNSEKRSGVFKCAGCGTPLFSSAAKYDSGTGWPSFFQPIDPKAVTEVPDYSIVFLPRTEVRCATCQGHLGHVFEDGPRDKTGLRYCMNGVSLNFDPASA